MNKKIFLFGMILVGAANVFAQQFNFYTIPNQSARFVRMPARDASTDIDAVFFNPAALTKLKEGLHFSANNQVLQQKTTITSDYQYLNSVPTQYKGQVGTPVFPNIYAVLKSKKFAFSLGFNSVAGAGTGDYESLPVADMGIADMVPIAQQLILDGLDQQYVMDNAIDPMYRNITGYRVDFASKGIAAFLGTQFGVSYELNDMFSLYGGGRYVYARVAFTGHTRNLEINAPMHGGWQTPLSYLTLIANDPLTNVGYAQAIKNTFIPALQTLVGDREIDAIKSGKGITPIVGVNITPNDRLNIGIRYEHQTRVQLETKVNDGKDGGGVFVDGSKERSDLPGFVGMGANYKILPNLTASLGARYMFDKSANYNGREQYIKHNYYEIATGMEYGVSKRFRVSAGYTFKKPSVSPEFQSDVDFRLAANTFAGGATYALYPNVDVTIGGLYTKSITEKTPYSHYFGQGVLGDIHIPTTKVYKQDAFIIALGVDFSIPTL